MADVLFSPIGSTDPIRGMHDGPLLHIVRHYRPEAVYLFLSKEMEEHDRNDNRYERCLKMVAPQCEVHKIYSGIVDVHKMNEFLGVFPEKLRQIREAYPQHRLLLNITSGTSQISMALSLACLTASAEVAGPGLTAVQVTTPEKKANLKHPPEGDDFDAALQMDFNRDQQDAMAECRCLEEDLHLLRRNNEEQRLLALCKGYEYGAALELYNKEKNLFSPAVGDLLLHCAYRSTLQREKALKTLAFWQGQDLFSVKQGTAVKASEYFMVMKLEHAQGKLANFILKLSPLLSYLTEHYVRGVLGYPLNRIVYVKEESHKRLSTEKMAKEDPGLLQFLRTYFGQEPRNGDLSLLNLLLIGDYLLQAKPKTLRVPVNPEVLELLHRLRAAEVYLRHKTAHEIVAVTEEFFKRAVDEETGQVLYTSSQGVLRDLERFLRLVLPEAAGAMRFMYDDLNSMLERELGQR